MNDETKPARATAGHPGHPDLETWIAYRAGGLPDAAALQDHLTRCQQCVDLVLDLDAFVDPSASSAAVSELERAAVWRALRGARKPVFYRVAVAAMAASLLVAALGALAWSHQQRTITGLEAQIADLEEPQINVPVLDLRPSSRQRSSGGAAVVTDLPAAARVALILSLAEPVDYPDFELRILSAGRAEIWSRRGLEPTEAGSFHLTLSPSSLGPGTFDLELVGHGDGREDLLEVYSVRLD